MVNTGLRIHQFVEEGSEEVLDWIAFAFLLVVEELAPVAHVFDEFPVAVDVGVEMAEMHGQRALGLGVARGSREKEKWHSYPLAPERRGQECPRSVVALLRRPARRQGAGV